jgi:hypothetical protein
MDGVREGANHPRKVLEALLYEVSHLNQVMIKQLRIS